MNPQRLSDLDPPAPPAEALAEAPPDLVALLALRAPDAGQPSRAVLAAAAELIRARQRERRTRRLAWAGWGTAAACAAVLAAASAGGGGGRAGLMAWLGGRDNGSGQVRHRLIPAGVEAPPDGQAPAEGTGTPRGAGAEAGHPEHSPGGRSGRLVSRNTVFPAPLQDVERMREELAKLRAAGQARFMGSARLSRTVVVEMTDPGRPAEAARAGSVSLPDRVAESIAAGISSASSSPDGSGASSGDLAASGSPSDSPPGPGTNTAPPEQDLVLSGGDGSWTGDVVIESGLPNTGFLNLPEGTQIRHKNFPVQDAASYRGLQDLGSGWYYDQFSSLLWQPAGQGQEYTGQKAPEGFDVETFVPPAGESAPQVAGTDTPAEGGGKATASLQAPEEPAASGAGTGLAQTTATALGSPQVPVRGYPIFDETTGSGSIILQNLAVPSKGMAYQLWVTDPSVDHPISIGLLPELEAGGGRVWFDLGGPGVAPAGYLLTLEPANGSSAPAGKIILQGP